ncbi:MAG: aldehyde dehydrogenase family protein [Conexivisphaerales archaeon]
MEPKLKKYGNLIDGRYDYEGEEEKLFSPADGSEVAIITKASYEKAKEAIDSAEDAFRNVWSKTTVEQRQKILLKLAEIVQERAEEYARLESLNTGKTLRQSTFMDIPLGIEHISYFAKMKEFRPEREIEHPEYPGTRGIVQYLPLGVVAAIAPWNVPFLMAVWKIAPALLAGNCVVLKPSHYTPLTALELAEDAIRAGLPAGVLNVVVGEADKVGNALLESQKVNHVSFTGSTKTGLDVMRKASNSLKRITLELGGKSPNIVFEDADIDRAAKGVLFGIYLNSGQLCESGSRLLVHSSIKEKLLKRMVTYLDRMKAGNPLDMETDLSAITTREQKKKIEVMVESSLSSGAKVVYTRDIDGFVPSKGLYYPPSIIGDVSKDMLAAREEIFGPVLAVMEFHTEDEAIQLANETEYGLAAGVWSSDISRAKRVAQNILAGTVWINEYHLLSAAAPRGGFKKSGLGRELGLEGVMELTQTRHLFINEGGSDLSEVAYNLVVREEG